MDYRILTLVIVAALCAVGYSRLTVISGRIRARDEFATEFLEKFQAYATSRGSDLESYSWLIHRSSKMQADMAGAGIVAHYKPPYANYQMTNYPIILNGIPELRQAFSAGYMSDVGGQIAEGAQDFIVRYLGQLDDFDKQYSKDLRNPMAWLREGVSLLVASPVYLLSAVGLLKSSTADGIANSRALRIASGIVMLLGLLSAIITIVLGWEQFTAVIARLSS